MDGWKGRIDHWLEKEREKREKVAARETEKQKRRREKEEAEKLTEHQRRFHCCVCGKPSPGPFMGLTGVPISDWPGWVDEPGPHWRIPTGGLKKCSQCGQWACEEHIHKGICQNCAKRLC